MLFRSGNEPDQIFIQSLAATWDSTQSEPLFKGPILPMTYSFPRRNTDPPSYNEAIGLVQRMPIPNLSRAAIRRTIIWPTTACAGSTSTYFVPDDDEGNDENY